MKPYGHIYEIVNLLDNKRYIGQSILEPEDCWTCRLSMLENGKHYNEHLQRAWNKYGEENFEFRVIQEEFTPQRLNEAEIWKIFWYRNLDLAYNMRYGGKAGGRPTEDTIQKIREARAKQIIVGKPLTEDHKAKIVKSWEMRKIKYPKYMPNEDNLENMRIAQQKRVSSPDYVNPNKGRPMSEEQKIKISNANKGKIHSEETKKKWSGQRKGNPGYWTGKKRSQETIEKMTANRKKPPLKTCCPSGHLFEAGSFTINNRGTRVCKLCKSIKDKKYRENRKEV